jgi:hypothetical protein
MRILVTGSRGKVAGGIAIDKARKLFGWDPQRSWRDHAVQPRPAGISPPRPLGALL